jgi:hypothetical protein
MKTFSKEDQKFMHTLARKTGLDYCDVKALAGMIGDKPTRIENFLKIQDKKGKLVPQKLYPHHRKYYKYAKPISYVLKGRQVWFTTTIMGDFYLDCIERNGINAAFINLDRNKTEAVFERAKIMHQNYPFKPSLKRDTGNKLSFAVTNSTFSALTAKNDMGERAAGEFGRSLTAHDVHLSEAAYIVHLRKMLDGIHGSRPKDGSSRIILESTGNGAQGDFYNDCMMIKDNGSEVVPNVWHFGEQSFHFIPWFEHLEYRLDYNPFDKAYLTREAIDKWIEYEKEHKQEMDKYDDMDKEDKKKAIYFLRYVAVNENGLAASPDRAIKITGQEYPAIVDHAFQHTGMIYLSATRIEQLSDKWKKYNAESECSPLPIIGRLIKTPNNKPEFTADSQGDIRLWFPPVYGYNNRYLVSGDIGGGLPDSDRDYITVRDRLRNLTVAVCHGTFGPKKTAYLMRMLGYWYDIALLVWENNNHGIGATIEFRREGYPNLYTHNDKRENDLDFGWQTTMKTRRPMLEIFRNDFENQISGWECPYESFYKEARAFKTPPGSKKDRPEGVNSHDDCVMGEAIASAVSSLMPDVEEKSDFQNYEPGTVGHVIVDKLTNQNNSKAYRNF